MRNLLVASLTAIALASVPAPVLAAPPDQAELGRNSFGEPCLATRYWDDPGIRDPFAVSYAVTCRGATGSRHLAIARRVRASDAKQFTDALACGDAAEFSVPSIGTVRARRCFDRSIGLETVETSATRGKHLLSVSAIPAAQGPAEEALRMLAGDTIEFTNRGRSVKPAVDVSQLKLPAGAAEAIAVSTDPEIALEEGLRFIRTGLHFEASRVLNDALSRLPADAPVKTRIEMLLVSGLADSNLRFFDSASDYFQRAQALLAANPGIQDASTLELKLTNYQALDLLNRRQFADAIGALSMISSTQTDPDQPLLDVTMIRALNQPSSAAKRGVQGLVSAPDLGTLSHLVIAAQAAWARSVALLAQNKPTESAAALAVADRNYAVLSGEKVDQRQVRWLEARIERQRARLLLRTHQPQAAVAALDKAIASLLRAKGEGATGPTLAETELERDGVLARQGGDPERLIANFDSAVDQLTSSDAQGAILPPAIEQYLDLLVTDAGNHPQGQSPERFFRALQAVGDPAIARQFIQLQTVATADPLLASKVQDAGDLEREITRIRFEIDSTPGTDAAAKAALDTRRQTLENELVAVQNDLQSNSAYSKVNDAPVTLAELRQALQPGEAYFKLSKVRNYVFGMLIDAQGTIIYRVKNPDIEIEPVANAVRDSIDGGGEKLPVYNVGAAYALFQIVAGPVVDRMLAAKALIVDANGPLQKLPIGVLVADKDSVVRYTAHRTKTPYDYTDVDFIAKRLSVSTALSPRSLIVSRKLPASTAPLPYMGFAQHEPTPVSAEIAGKIVSVGSNCQAEQKAIALLTRELTPINARELDRAGAALGLSQVPELTGAAFTDTAVKEMTNLDQFQVLHFATHGLTEGVWGCSKSPPALVTTMGADNSDALLSFDEIARLRLDANLVVLSACDTAAGISLGQARAAGQEEAGATLEGLVRAFLAANARAVLSTYWPISNAGESEDLIADFYRTARTGTIGEALRVAQTTIMANPKSSHPIYWGAFFVVGDAQKPLLTGAAKMALSGPPVPFVAPAPRTLK